MDIKIKYQNPFETDMKGIAFINSQRVLKGFLYSTYGATNHSENCDESAEFE